VRGRAGRRQDASVAESGTAGAAESLVGRSVPEILRDLYVGRRTGLLHFARGDALRSVRFDKGRIVHAATNDPDRRFGDVLVRDGLLTQAQLVQAERHVRDKGRRFGRVLVEMHLLSEKAFEDALALYVREVLLDVFSWEESVYSFEEGAPVGDEDHTLKLSTGEMILEAVRLVESERAIRRALGDLDRVLAVTSDPFLRFQRISLTPTDGYVMSRVDGITAARGIIEMVPLPTGEVERSLFGLLCTGIIEYLACPTFGDLTSESLRTTVLETHAGLHTRNHFEVLGVLRSASAEEIKAAYLRLVRRFHPDNLHSPGLHDLRDKLDEIFQRISAAHDVLSHPQRRLDYEGFLARATAEEPSAGPKAEAGPPVGWSAERAIEDAEHMLGEGKSWEAVGLLYGALPFAQGRVRQRMRLLRAKVYLKHPGWTRQAEEELRLALQEDESSSEAHYLLGTLFQSAGLVRRAAAHYRSALLLRPDYRDAKLRLEELGPAADERG
jgi:curved DNA-binding protein CbpA